MRNVGVKTGPEEWQRPLVVVLGMGTGRRDLSEQALQWVRRAEVLAGTARHMESFSEHTGERLPFRSPLAETLERVERVSRERRTMVLASGDPFYFGIGRRLIEVLGRERVLAIPNITSVQALFARLGEPWEDVRAMSLHGRESAAWLRAFRRHGKIALFTDHRHTPAWIAGRLLDASISDYELVVAEDLGLPTERIRSMSLEEARTTAFSPLNLTAAFRMAAQPGEEKAGVSLPILGLPEEAFRHEAGLSIKMDRIIFPIVFLPHLPLIQPSNNTNVGRVSSDGIHKIYRKIVSSLSHPVNRADPVRGKAPDSLSRIIQPSFTCRSPSSKRFFTWPSTSE